MPTRAALSKLSRAVDSASEDEIQCGAPLMTPDSALENRAPAATTVRRGRSRAKADSATQPPPKKRAAAKDNRTALPRVSDGSKIVVMRRETAVVSKDANSKAREPRPRPRPRHKALAEKANLNGNDTEEVDEFDEGDAQKENDEVEKEVQPVRRGRFNGKAAAKAPRVTQAPAKPVKEPNKPQRKQKKANGSGAAKREPSPESRPLAQHEAELEPDSMDIDESNTAELNPTLEPVPTLRPTMRPAARRKQKAAATPSQRQPSACAALRHRGSASDTERSSSDAALRRTLGGTCQKLEALTVKYDNLKEAASSSRESIFEQLKRTTEQRARGSFETVPPALMRVLTKSRPGRSHSVAQEAAGCFAVCVVRQLGAQDQD